MSEFDIQYHLRTTIKIQIVAEFIAEFTHNEDKGVKESPQWSIHTDGSSNRQAGGGEGAALYYYHLKETQLNA